jgi:hypothetical protein
METRKRGATVVSRGDGPFAAGEPGPGLTRETITAVTDPIVPR